jgi:exonuclease VII large subunit
LAAWPISIPGPARAGEQAAPPAKEAAAAVKPKPAEPAPMAPLTDERAQEMAKATGLTSDVVRAGVEYIQKYKPRLARDLDNILKTSPPQFRSNVKEMSSYMRDLQQLKRSDPARAARREQLLELDAQAERLTDRYKESTDTDRMQIEVALTNILAKAFDFRLEDERYQLEQARKQMEQLQDRINQRVKNKTRIVDRQMTTLLGINDLLTW